MGSKTYMGAILRLLVSLAGVSLCCLCLAPVARADWGTIHCETGAHSMDVASAKEAIAAYQKCGESGHCDGYCCQFNGFESQCTTLWTWNSRAFYMCGSLRCDLCFWISGEWQKVIDHCTESFNGVERAGGYVAYNWNVVQWEKYGF